MTPARWTAGLLLAAWLLGWGPAGAAEEDGRGRAAFEGKHCARCHPAGGRGVGPALEELRRPQGALELAGRLWNHSPAMFVLLRREGLEWPRIDVEEMRSLMRYLQAAPARDPTPDLLRGQVLLIRKGCLKCHRLRKEGGSVGIELTTHQGGYRSGVEWAATIWNHSPRMARSAEQMGFLYPRFAGEEMAHLFGFLKSAAATAPR